MIHVAYNFSFGQIRAWTNVSPDSVNAVSMPSSRVFPTAKVREGFRMPNNLNLRVTSITFKAMYFE